jgi:hypothetical protein
MFHKALRVSAVLIGALIGVAAMAPVYADTATTTTLASSANPSVFGQPVTFTATVASTPAASGGTVTFKDGTTSIGSAPLTAGSAAVTVSNLAVGGHNVTATYSGATGFTGSTSAVLNQRVNRGDTTTTVTSSLNPSIVGDSVTFTATIAVVAPAAGTPTGSVAFSDETWARSLGTVALTGNTATLTTSTLARGSHRILAIYSGDANFLSSRNAVTQKVLAPSVTLTSPVGGEVWAGGSTHAITWTYTDSPGTAVKIVLWKAGERVGVITQSTPIGTNGVGSFNWTIPALKPADNYRVDVSVVEKPSVSDRSKPFTIS